MCYHTKPILCHRQTSHALCAHHHITCSCRSPQLVWCSNHFCIAERESLYFSFSNHPLSLSPWATLIHQPAQAHTHTQPANIRCSTPQQPQYIDSHLLTPRKGKWECERQGNMQTLTSKHTHNKRHTRTLTDKICCHIPSCFLSTEGDDRKLSPAKSAGLMYIPTSPSLYSPLPSPV